MAQEHELRVRIQLLEHQVETLGSTLREVVSLVRELNKVNKESTLYEPEGLVRKHDDIEAKLRSANADLEGWSPSA